MTDIKQVSDWALTIAAEAAGSKLHHYERMADDNRLAQSIEAHARAIEQHEAFRQEVSDSIEHYLDQWRHSTPSREVFACQFGSFIIAKPDPLVEVINDADNMVRKPDAPSYAEALRAAIEKRGGKIVWGEG